MLNKSLLVASVLLLIQTADLGKFDAIVPEAWCDLLLS